MGTFAAIGAMCPAPRGGLYRAIQALFLNAEKGVWYDPSDLTSMFQDSAGTTAAVVGQPVGKILDKSGNGYHATQSTSTARPILRQSGSLYYLEFDGVDDFLVTPAINFSGTDKMSVFAGVRKIGMAGALVCELSTAVGIANPGSFYLAAPEDATYEFSAKGIGTLNPAPARIDSATYDSPATVVQTLISNISGDLNTLRLNGATAGTGALDLGLGNFGNYAMYIGMRAGTSLPFNGHLYSLVVRGALSDAAQIASAEAFVAGKTGVTL